MSTSESWGVNGHTAWYTSPIYMVSQCKLVSGWGLRKRRSAPPYMGPVARERLYFFTICNPDCIYTGLLVNWTMWHRPTWLQIICNVDYLQTGLSVSKTSVSVSNKHSWVICLLNLFTTQCRVTATKYEHPNQQLYQMLNLYDILTRRPQTRRARAGRPAGHASVYTRWAKKSAGLGEFYPKIHSALKIFKYSSSSNGHILASTDGCMLEQTAVWLWSYDIRLIHRLTVRSATLWFWKTIMEMQLV